MTHDTVLRPDALLLLDIGIILGRMERSIETNLPSRAQTLCQECWSLLSRLTRREDNLQTQVDEARDAMREKVQDWASVARGDSDPSRSRIRALDALGDLRDALRRCVIMG